mgnify:CR=1 FL=1
MSHVKGMYLEAGAIPALLLQISESFHMPSGKQGTFSVSFNESCISVIAHCIL